MGSSIYDPLWDKLKNLSQKEASEIGVQCTAPRKFHARIRKAVGKRKKLDLIYKLMITPKKARLEIASIGVILHFKLKVSLAELSEEDI